MTVAIANFVQEKTGSTGTGPLLLSSLPGRRGFYAAFGSGGSDVFYYFICHATEAEWEAGTGHMSDAATLVRDTVIESSNEGAAVDFSPGRKDVVNDLPAGEQDVLRAASAAGLKGGFGATIDGGGSAVTTGVKAYLTALYAGTVTGWCVSADQSGDIVFDIKRGGTSMIGDGNAPGLSSAQNASAAVAGWASVAVAAGDVLEISVVAASAVTWAYLGVRMEKTP